LVDRDAEVVNEVFEMGEESMGLTIGRDISIFPGQQKAMQSRGYKGAYLAGKESRVSRLHELVDNYIAGHLPKKQRLSALAVPSLSCWFLRLLIE
jgi:hypothetical protein